MAGEDEIVVNEEARVLMNGLESHDPGAPSVTAVQQVTGASKSGGSQDYRAAMKNFAADSHTTFQNLLQAIQADCATAIDAIDDFHRQDDEIATILKKYNLEVHDAALASQFGSGTAGATGNAAPVNAPSASASTAPSPDSGDSNW